MTVVIKQSKSCAANNIGATNKQQKLNRNNIADESMLSEKEMTKIESKL